MAVELIKIDGGKGVESQYDNTWISSSYNVSMWLEVEDQVYMKLSRDAQLFNHTKIETDEFEAVNDS